MLSSRRIMPAVTIFIGALFMHACFPTIAASQGSKDVDPELGSVQPHTAPVKVDGRVLFYVRGISSYPAELRATTISNRIEKAASNPLLSTDSLTIVPGEDRLQIYAGEEFIMNVYDGDAEMEGTTQKVLAGVILQKTGAAIDLYRHERSRPVLVKKGLSALGAAALLTVLLFVFFRLIRRLDSGLHTRMKSGIDIVESKSFKLIRSDQLWRAFHAFVRTFKILVTVVIVAAFLEYILGLFPWTNNVAVQTLEAFLYPVVTLWGGFIRYLPSLVFLIVIVLVTRYLLKLIKLLFAGVQHGGIVITNFEPDWAMPTFKIVRILVITLAVVVAYPYIPGSESSAFQGVSVFLGVLFSLGSSSFIGNVIAGYSMTYRRAFRIGDRIKVDDHVGFVEEQKLLVTRLRSVKNEEIVIPNSVLLNSNIINYSTKAKESGLILHTTVGIGYETPWRMVDAMLKLAADRTEGLMKQPPPFVLKQSLGDFAVNYEINVYCNDASRMYFYYNALHQNILDVFNENNVQIMTPAYEGDPEKPKVVPKDQWETSLASEK